VVVAVDEVVLASAITGSLVAEALDFIGIELGRWWFDFVGEILWESKSKRLRSSSSFFFCQD
jgi:hypothetical protein